VTETERAQLLVTARFLRATKSIDWLAMGLTLVAAWSLPRPASIIALVLGVIAKYLGFRIAFDASLFADLAEGRLTMEAFDEAAVSLTLMPRKKAGRPIAVRCRGARRLVTLIGVVTAAQLLALGIRSFFFVR